MTGNGQLFVVALSPDSKYLVAGGCDVEITQNFCAQGDGIARVLDVRTGTEVAHMVHDHGVTSAAFSPDGKYVASGGQDGKIKVWYAKDGQDIAQMSHDSEYEINFVAFSPDGKYVVSSGNTHTMRVWEAATGKEIASMPPGAAVNSIAFSPDGKYVVSGGCDEEDISGTCIQGTARVWEAATGNEVTKISYGAAVYSAMFSPDGKYVASGGCDEEDTARTCIQGTARVWEATTGKEVARISYGAAVDSVAFSPDGKYVLSRSNDNTAQIWEVATSKEIARITQDNNVSSLAFSPDGKYIVSGSEHTAHLWETTTGQEITRITQNGAVTFAAFTPDGKYLVTMDGDRTIVAWLYRPEDLIVDACSRVTRNLTPAEWEQYIGEALPYRAICSELPLEPEVISNVSPRP
jgi:WD40 repeat protein